MNTLIAIRRARPEISDATPDAIEDARVRLRAAIVDTPQRIERHPDDRTVDRNETTDRATVTTLDHARPPGTRSSNRRRLWWLGAAASVAAISGAAILLPDAAETPDTPDVVVEVPPSVPDTRPTPAKRGAVKPTREPFGTFATITRLEHNWSGEGGSTAFTRPDATGPWPVVILFGDGLAPATNGPPTTSIAGRETTVAELLASAGLMVAVVDWEASPESTYEDLQLASRSVACAVAAAHQGAPAEGGDKSRFAVVGWGPTAAAAIHSSTTATSPRPECIQPMAARAELIIAVGADLGALPEGDVGAWARFNRNKKILFLTGTAEEASVEGRTPSTLARELNDLEYIAKVEVVEGSGSSISAMDDPATREVLDRIVDAAHAIGP